MNIIFLMGPTNCGKTTLIDRLPDEFYPVLVGKKLREMFTPDYFDGQAAPAKTDELAFSLMCYGIQEALSLGKIPVIDGQPRNYAQYELCKKYFDDDDFNCKFCILWSDKQTRIDRANNRDKDDPAKLKLSMDRMDGDVIILYDMISMLQMNYGDNLKIFNSSDFDYYNELVEFIKN